jgi:8-oxo-dGTP pyrophosphatase MutT (NUDIX family)
MDNPWTTLSSKEIYSDPWIKVRLNEVLNPDKSLGTYSVVILKGGIGVVAIDDMERVLLVGQYRYPLNRYSWEIPKGAFETFERDEDPIVTAKRELLEETGAVAKKWIYLGFVHTLMGSTNDEVHLFEARNLVIGVPKPDKNEVLQVRWVHFDQFWNMVKIGDITDATSIAALALSQQ